MIQTHGDVVLLVELVHVHQEPAAPRVPSYQDLFQERRPVQEEFVVEVVQLVIDEV